MKTELRALYKIQIEITSTLYLPPEADNDNNSVYKQFQSQEAKQIRSTLHAYGHGFKCSGWLNRIPHV